LWGPGLTLKIGKDNLNKKEGGNKNEKLKIM
jgi:hypothetical protein